MILYWQKLNLNMTDTSVCSHIAPFFFNGGAIWRLSRKVENKQTDFLDFFENEKGSVVTQNLTQYFE